MSVNLGEICAEIGSSREARIAAHTAGRLRQAQVIRDTKAEYKRLKDLLSRKQSLRTQSQTEGVDTAPIDLQIAEIEPQLRAWETKAAELEAEYTAGSDRADVPSPELSKKLAEALLAIGCRQALEVKDISDCMKGVAIALDAPPAASQYHRRDDDTFLELDDCGAVKATTVWFDSMHSVRVPIVSSKPRYHPDAVPESLDWTRPFFADGDRDESATKRSTTGSQVPLAWFVRETQAIITSIPMDSPHLKSKRSLTDGDWAQYTSWTWKTQREACKTLVPGWGIDAEFVDARNRAFKGVLSSSSRSLPDEFMAALQQLGNVLDLDATLRPTSLLHHVQHAIIAELQDNPPFPTSTADLPSEEIAAMIGQHWGHIASAPWSWAIRGTLAKLKYTLEGRERPRFWNIGFEGNYGFRLRTKDHTWLIGECLIDPGWAPKDGESVVIENHTKQREKRVLAAVGPVMLWVEESE